MCANRPVCPRRPRNCRSVANHPPGQVFSATYTDLFLVVTMLVSLSASQDGCGSLLVCRRYPGISHQSSLVCSNQNLNVLPNCLSTHFSSTISHHCRHLSSKGTTRSWRSGIEPSSAGSLPSFIVAWISKSCARNCSKSFSENYE